MPAISIVRRKAFDSGRIEMRLNTTARLSESASIAGIAMYLARFGDPFSAVGAKSDEMKFRDQS